MEFANLGENDIPESEGSDYNLGAGEVDGEEDCEEALSVLELIQYVAVRCDV